MNIAFLFAAHGVPASRWYQHFGVVFFLVGILCVLLGILVGWLAWRYCQRDAARIDAENLRLEDELKKSRAEVEEFASQINQFGKS